MEPDLVPIYLLDGSSRGEEIGAGVIRRGVQEEIRRAKTALVFEARELQGRIHPVIDVVTQPDHDAVPGRRRELAQGDNVKAIIGKCVEEDLILPVEETALADGPQQRPQRPDTQHIGRRLEFPLHVCDRSSGGWIDLSRRGPTAAGWPTKRAALTNDRPAVGRSRSGRRSIILRMSAEMEQRTPAGGLTIVSRRRSAW
jgi:hypothetical protein